MNEWLYMNNIVKKIHVRIKLYSIRHAYHISNKKKNRCMIKVRMTFRHLACLEFDFDMYVSFSFIPNVWSLILVYLYNFHIFSMIGNNFDIFV
jgi:hypothetical protein